MSARLLGPVLALLVSIAAAGCCGGDSTKSTRWDTPTAKSGVEKNTPPPKDGPKPIEGGALNKFFPSDGADGHKRVFTQEKAGFAEAKLQKDGKDVATLSINDASATPDAKGKFSSASDKVKGWPLVTVGKNQSALLVKDRWQVKVSSPTLDEGARKAWLERFDLSGLSSL
jgi:hypothetical protein